MSEFPEIQPFGPRPAQHNENPPTTGQPVTTPQAVPASLTAPTAKPVNVNVIVTAVAVGFALGYAAARYQQLIISQSKIDEFVNYAQDWIREQGPKLAEPIKHSLESTGSTVEQAFKKVSASRPLESLHLFQRQKPRKFLGLDIF
jgi:adenine/guanine phosphoribosyltransferase-like PRPP-binding protein